MPQSENASTPSSWRLDRKRLCASANTLYRLASPLPQVAGRHPPIQRLALKQGQAGVRDVVIVRLGPAGYTAAAYALDVDANRLTD